MSDQPNPGQAGIPSVRTPLPVRLAWVPIPLFLLVILVLWAGDFRASYESPIVLIGLNFVLLVLAFLAIAYLMGRSFLAKPSPGLLVVGCGALAWGLAGLVGAVAALPTEASGFSTNTLVTVHNTCIWLSALCHLTGAAFALRWQVSLCAPRLWLALAYGITAGLVGLIAQAALSDWMPVFFAEGQGGTPLRQYVLGSAIAMLALTVLILRAMNQPRWSSFAHWYALGLGLLAVGLLGVMLQRVSGSLLGWTGRAVQFWGGAYMIMAAITSLREWGDQGIRLGRALGETRHRYIVAIAWVAAATLVRLVFLQELGTRVAFITFFPAVMVAALYGGLRAGLLAAVLAAILTDYFWMEPVGQFAIGHSADWLAIAVFLLSCTGISAITEAMHRAQARALHAEALARDGIDPALAERVVRQRERRLAGEQLKAVFPVNVAFPAALAMLVLLAWLAYQNTTAMREADRWEGQTHQIVHSLYQLQSALAEAESCANAYLVTGDENYQAAQAEAAGQVSRQLAFLQGLAADNPAQLKPLLALAAPVQGALAELEQAIATRRAQGFAAARQKMESSGWKERRAAIRAQVTGFQDEALRLLEERGADKHDGGTALLRTGGLGVLFSMALLSLVFLALRREIAERVAAERELASHRDQLEAVVQARTAELEQEIAGHRATDRALLENEERLRLVLQASSIGTFEIDLAGGHGRWSPVTYQLLGLQPGAANPSPETFFGFVHPDDKERVISQWEEALRTGQLDYEFRIVRADGEVRWLAGRGRFALGEEAEGSALRRFLGVNFDITDRKRAEERLLRSEAALAKAQTIANLGSWEWDLPTGEVRWSDQMFRMFGEEPHAWLASYDGFLARIHPDDRQRVDDVIHGALAQGMPFSVEYRIFNRQGEVHTVLAQAEVELAGDGSIARAAGTCLDITERKEAETIRARLAAIVESSQDAIIGKDLEGRVTSWNQGAEQLFGYTEEEMLGRPVSILAPQSHGVEALILERICQGEAVAHYETEQRRKDGSLVIVSITVSPVKDAAGTIIGASKIARDITARRRMEEERDQYISLVKTSTDFIGMCDLQGALFFVNEAGMRLVGIDGPETLARISVSDFFFPEDQAFIVGEFLPRTLQGPAEMEIRFRHFKTGEAIWMVLSVFALRDSAGRPSGYATVSRNITERKRAEDALRQERLFLRQVIDAVPSLIFVKDRQCRVLLCNEAFARDYGTTADDLVGKSNAEISQRPDEVDRFCKDDLEVIDTGKPKIIEEEKATHADGSVHWYSTVKLPMRNAQGVCDRVLGVATDITVRKQAEEARRQSQADLNRAQAVAHTGSWRLDIRRNVLTWSEENHRIFGIPPGTPLSYETFLACVHPDDRDFVHRAWQAALAGKPYDVEHRIVVGEAVKWLRERAELEWDEEGTLLGGFGTAQDISELKSSQHALQEADRRKDEFLAMLAHELRNPLTPIMVAAQMLQKRGAEDPSLVKWAGDTVKHQCDNLVQLVNQLLDVSRVTKGKITLHKMPVDLRELLQRAVESCRPFIDQHGHELIVTPASEPMPAEVDAVRIEQVLGNLLNNAAKYTPKGGKIWLSLERQADAAVIRVRDSGIGISAAMLPSVFDLFAQAERTLDRAQGGLGIGLALVKSLVEMHGGSVKARSDGIGAGSEFEVRLPLLEQTPAVDEAPAEVSGQAPAKARRLLVVDDNDDVRQSMALLLRAMGHQVWEAASGREALEMAKTVRLDAVLLDIGMPGLNGYEVARLLRKEPALAKLTLIAMTGYSQEGDRQASLRAGFDHHVVKPFDPAELAELLEG